MASAPFSVDDATFFHCVITQFNLRNFRAAVDQETWLRWTRERVILFRKYCLPSFLNQTTTNFKWLIFFDKETPPEFYPLIDELKKEHIIEICYSDGSEDFYQNHTAQISAIIPDNVGWVITSRVDNDDCIHKDYVKTVQQKFRPKQNYLISSASGYVLDTATSRMSHYYYPMSPFISLVEATDKQIAGIFSRQHTQWDALRLWMAKELWLHYIKPKNRVADFILKDPLWIQIVHGNNVSNSFHRGLPVVSQKDLSDFVPGLVNSPAKWSSIDKYLEYVSLKRYFKSTVTRLLTNK